MDKLYGYLNFIQLYVVLTVVMLVLHWRYVKKNSLFICIVLINLIIEVVSLILAYVGISINYAYNIGILLHDVFWITLLFKIFGYGNKGYILPAAFVLFGICNLIFGEGIDNFNCNTFIIGSFIYLIVFLFESFKELKVENFNFFFSANFILIFAPVMFFLGLSFEFSFKSHELGEFPVLGSIKLYDFISHFVNVIYYTLLNIYIIKVKQFKYAG